MKNKKKKTKRSNNKSQMVEKSTKKTNKKSNEQQIEKTFKNASGKVQKMNVTLLQWEALDYVDKVKKVFHL